ncbi:hypothetical protein K456DRAFT_37807 [Colletotrichum gloeosporioides 23]|nr:hypothetical protein K456DRAFT_37807 [Colletotrichum gloeosporioides 23]
MSLGNDTETSKVHGVYAGHMGCVVIGHDQYRWTTHFAIDTWFEDCPDAQDKVMRYQCDLEVNMELDPLSCGRNDARRPIWHPRAYFLEVTQNRLEQVKDEWELVLQNLDQGVSKLAETQKGLRGLSQFQYRDGSTNIDNHGSAFKEFESFEALLGELKEILQDLSQVLQQTRKTGEFFLATDVNFFLNYDGHHGDASECYPFLAEIRRKFQDIGQMCVSMDSLQTRCNYMTEDCEATRRKITEDIVQLKAEIRQLSKTQSQHATLDKGEIIEVRLLALSTLITLPFTHTTALFSADGVVAFRKDWKNFLASLLCAYVLMLIITAALRCWINRAGGSIAGKMTSPKGQISDHVPEGQPRHSFAASSGTYRGPQGSQAAEVEIACLREHRLSLWSLPRHRRLQSAGDVELGLALPRDTRVHTACNTV